MLEGENEVVTVNAWTSTRNYDEQKEELKQLASNVKGIEAPLSTAGSEPSTAPTDNAAGAPSIGEMLGLETVAPSGQTTSSTTIPGAPSAVPASTFKENAADRLRELSKLYKEGVITPKEFEIKKQEILKSM